MTTKEFLTVLENHPNFPLLFEYQQGTFVRQDYHITEIKNVDFDTVDCGGVQNNWQEVHVQLWENEMPEPNHQVNTTKALEIFQAVYKVRPTWAEVEMKFEYGNQHFPTSVLPVGAIEIHDDKILVKLGANQTCCKAKDRATTPEDKAAACCAPVVSVVAMQKPKIDLANLVADNNNSCTPGGGCC